MATYSSSPYYDRYSGDSTHRKNGYTRVLAKPGLAEQASEFNEIQSIARDYVERLGSALYSEGTIISGCSLQINAAATTVTLTAGRVFLEGLVRETSATTLSITGSGVERIVATVVTTIVTATQDSSLRDPAQGAENYGLEGADREKQVVSFSVVSGDASTSGVTLYTLEDGQLPVVVTEADKNIYVTNDVLAERTYDENGSYKVKGIMLRDMLEVDGDKIKLYVTSGKAYVKGYSVTRETMSSLYLDQSTSTRAVQSESHYYNSSYSQYELSNGPVAAVQNFTCLVSVVGERKSKGTKDGMDSLNHVPVDSISRVYEMDSNNVITTVYRQGVDYKLYNDKIDWSLSGDSVLEPSNGTTYYVDYTYNKSMVLGTDYTISNSADTAYLTFLSGGDKPDENSRMYITYTYTLARRDLVMMNSLGELVVLKGQPDKLTDLITPYNGSDEYLVLGYVDVYPTDALTGEVLDGIADVANYNSIRFSQEDIYNLMRRINILEDDLATLDMEREIEDGEDSSSLNGYFTDPFKNINHSDLGYVATIDGKTVAFTAGIDPVAEELSTLTELVSADLTLDTTNSGTYASYGTNGTIISAPYTVELALQQKYATGTVLVNEYASYGPLCQVVITPERDNWIDEEETQVYNVVTSEVYTNKVQTYNRTLSYSNVAGLISLQRTYGVSSGSTTSSTTTTYTNTTVSQSTTSSVAETIYEYMRTNTISVEGTAFADAMMNIYCLFNEIPIDITATGTTSQGSDITVNGTTVKTVNADENGHFTGTITVPEKVPCGSVTVTFTGTNSLGEQYTGGAVYTANGSLLTTTITNTVNIEDHYEVLTTNTKYTFRRIVDPVAESFVLDTVNPRILIKLGLYFATKSSNRPAILQIRNMVNGYPGDTVLSEISIDPDDVNLPTDADTPVVTEITLKTPVYCEANTPYCFAVLSDSNAYSMYYAEMGQNLLGTTDQLVINPYGTGVMFSSSNATTWTAHQTADLKFELYTCRFTGNIEILFNEMELTDTATGVYLDAAYQDSANNGLEWYYRFKSSSTYSDWLPIDTLTQRDFNKSADVIGLKAVLKTNNLTTPFIDIGRVSLRAYVDQMDSIYISRHIPNGSFDEEYQALKISYQIALPSGTSHEVYYMDTLDGDWIQLETDNNVSLETKRVDSNFTQFIWNVSKVNAMVQDNTLSGVKFFKMRIDLHTTVQTNRPRVKKLTAIFKFA